MSHSDRKAYRRHPRIPVDMMINKFVDDQPYMVRVKDISMSGVYFHKLIEPRFIENEDSEVGLELRLPGWTIRSGPPVDSFVRAVRSPLRMRTAVI